ncbi:heme oxygenase (biliverdin-producing) [Sinomonas mesophila]|uniref:biliverdin-producing heme oxygenase n=1 Tax=Sinomonas mesophila TaxID=1531955 RepID=UPI0009851C6E|nr:biliverdin-producing heme oxygenase [Sinomonas mesophila]
MTAFAEELKSHTEAAHRHAEEAAFVSDLLAGRLDAAQVAVMLAQNLAIYRALEAALAANRDPRLAPFTDPALERVPALESDMRYHFGPEWAGRLEAGDVPSTPGALAYAGRIEALGPASATFLLANHYVRYLGDLSGGQIIASIVQRHYGVPSEGLAFYAFSGVPKPKPYKDAYRAKLDAAAFSRGEKDEILAYAVESFELNRQVFLDLSAARVGSAAH